MSFSFMRGSLLLAGIGCLLVLTACESAPVTGRNQLILVPEAESTEMGLQAYQQILDEKEIATNSDMQRQVTRIGKRIAAVADRPDFDWEFNVIEDETPNAFALPGGKVGVHSGLFDVAKTEDQLAAVMAHEIAHAIARHGAERISHQMALQGGLAGVAAATGAATESSASYTQVAAAAATLGVILPFSRTQESEADEIGLILMAKAGYDPRTSIELWRNFEDLGGDRPAEFLSTHPSPGNRIARLQELMPEALKYYENRAS